jgi:CHAT domain-containing protein
LIASIAAQPATDTLFACHGQYSPDNLDASYLRLVGRHDEGLVPFSRIFSELDMRGRRSVIMGACESGMSRTTIGAEYIGLPAAMLSSGVPLVIGASWKVPQLATAVLMARFLGLLKDPSIDFCSALCDSQRALKSMTREDLSIWIRERMTSGAELDEALREVAARNELPFAHPYHWSGLQVVGDV